MSIRYIAVGCGIISVGGGLIAIGAASGAIGASILRAAYPDWVDISIGDFTKAMMVGNLMIGAISALPISVASFFDLEPTLGCFTLQIAAPVVGTVLHCFLSGEIGGNMLGLVQSDADFTFSILANLLGTSILYGGVYSLGWCPVRCPSVQLLEIHGHRGDIEQGWPMEPLFFQYPVHQRAVVQNNLAPIVHNTAIEEALDQLMVLKNMDVIQLEKFLLDAKLDNALLCPISGQLMRDPVCVATGHTYDYSQIHRWLTEHNTNPITGDELPSKNLIPNVLIRSIILERLEQLSVEIEAPEKRAGFSP